MQACPARSLAAALLAAALPVAGCTDVPRPGDPDAPPQIVALRVLGCETGVRVEFFDDLDPASVTLENLYIEDIPGLPGYDPAGRAATFRPETPLESGRRQPYVLVAGPELRSLGGTPMPAALRWAFSCMDLDAPGVVARFPLGDQVATLVRPSAKFGEAMDEASLEGALRVAKVAGTTSWDAPSRTLELRPARPLYPARTYTVTVARTARDRAGNALGSDVTWSFRTRPPLEDWAARLVVPPVARAAPCDTAVALRLAEGFAVDEAALQAGPLDIDGVRVAAVQWDAARRLVRLVPESPLLPHAEYPLVASGALRDVHGDTPFDDGAQVAVLRTVQDCGAVAVAEVPDAEGALACDAPTTVRFTTAMDAASLAQAVRLRDLAYAPDVAASVTLSADGTVATVRPAAPLVHGHRYELSVGGDAKSAAGVSLGTGGAWQLQARCP